MVPLSRTLTFPSCLLIHFTIKIKMLIVIITYLVIIADPASPTSINCNALGPATSTCQYNNTCVYGELNEIQCNIIEEIACDGDRSFTVKFPCLYCWQLPEQQYICEKNSTCQQNTRYLTTCIVNSTTYCLGSRQFKRYKQCDLNDTDYKWSTTLIISILFGGFGVDRFYLGYWQAGIGKLFSFGGFGVWTLIDTILIYLGYLKPERQQNSIQS